MNERRVSGGNYVFFGGSTGIGQAAAVELGRRGANVLIVGRDERPARSRLRPFARRAARPPS